MLSRIGHFIQALRLYTFPVPVTPVCICAALAAAQSPPLSPVRLALLLAGVCALFFAANLVNEYHDFQQGVDTPQSLGSSRVLVLGLVEPRLARRCYRLLYGAAVLIGVYFVALRGLPLLALLGAGIAGGYLYTAGPYPLKYHGWGEVLVFSMMGPLLFCACSCALTGGVSGACLALSVASGVFSASILSANNLRDFHEDARAGITTVATALGWRGARIFFAGMLLFPFAFLAAAVWCGILSRGVLLSWLALPGAAAVLAAVWKEQQVVMRKLVQASAALQLLFSFFLILGIVWTGKL